MGIIGEQIKDMSKESITQQESHKGGKSLSDLNYYFMSNALTNDIPICRYMNFDAFLNILEGKYWVQRREFFKDAKEKGEIPLAKRMVLRYVGENAPSPNTQLIKAESEEKELKYQLLKRSKHLLTSCWALDNGEDYLMWKSYTDKCGVCIRTTIGELLEAIKFKDDGYVIICSPMFYEGVQIKDSITSMIMSKERFYSSENEIRFYFLKNNHFLHEDLENLDNARFEALLEETIEDEAHTCETEKGNKKGEIFPVNPNFINSVILSPFILPSSVENMKKLLQKNYPELLGKKNMIKESEIKINE